MSYKTINPLHQEIGKTIASEKFLNTMDGFWFALNPNVIINSFDFVTVNNLFDSKTIGIVKELQAVDEHDYHNYLSDYHKLSTTKEQLKQKGKEKEEKRKGSERKWKENERKMKGNEKKMKGKWKENNERETKWSLTF